MLLLLTSSKATSSTRGQLRVYTSATTNAIKPVKVWNGTNWVIKPVRYWTGSAWAFTFDTTYRVYEDTSDSGFFIGNGASENSGDPGFFDSQSSSALREDTNEPGTYINGG